MELLPRARGDILLPAGEMTAIRQRLRAVADRHDLATVIAYAFDHRTRILPFIYADMRMVPAGVRAIGAAMLDSGFVRTRIVLQQWNRNFQPSQMRLDGRIPDIFMVSSMHLHAEECDRMVADACRIEPERRPLIIAGGPRVIYEPWQMFSGEPARPAGADVAVTGEEYVLLQLLETLLALRATGESMRSVFYRARDCGALDGIPGLVYGNSSSPTGPVEELVDTGIQRLLGDLDELPSPVPGYAILEPPSSAATLGSSPLAAKRVRKLSMISSIVMTVGCKFRCAYCPIPAYNQRQHRVKSGERVADEIDQLYKHYHISNYFGTDDNFFNDIKRTMDICEPLARRAIGGQKPFNRVRFGSEATVHDTIRIQEHLPTIRRAGLFAVWMGVEDLTGTLVKKGQSESKTLESFSLLRQNGIYPVPMMMHHDTQPLVTRKGNYGLLNQLRVLRKAGALYTQVLMLTPSPGSKWYEDTYTSGMVFDTINGQPVEPHRGDGNYVLASKHPRPWLKQLNMLVGYTYFFNPLRMLLALFSSKSSIPFADTERRTERETQNYSPFKRFRRKVYLKARAHVIDAIVQLVAMFGLFHTYRRTLRWAWRLYRGQIEHSTRSPASRIPMRGINGGMASHALPGTPEPANGPRVTVELPVITEHSCGKAA